MHHIGHRRRRRLIILLSNLLLGALASAYAIADHDGLIAALVRATHATWDKQPKFGLFHVLSLAVCVLVCILICAFEDRIRLDTESILFAVGLVFFWLEIYKQLYYALILSGGYYNFGILPLQLCSYVLYLFPIIPLLSDGKLKDAMCAFCALYLTVGGITVLIYPYMFLEIPLAIHTMLWHTLMVAASALILKRGRLGTSFAREVLPATLIFICTLGVAVALNFVLTPFSQNSLEPLNLFYVSPYEKNNYALIGDVQRAAGWFPAVVCYALLALIGASALWAICKFTKRNTKVK